MKLKSLILGSVAAVGLSTAGFAADLGVLTSLDVCDDLGLSGLTISSDTNCLQITGSVAYTFEYGNFNGTGAVIAATPFSGSFGGVNADGNVATDAPLGAATGSADWDSKVETFLKFVGTQSSDFGPARVVINLRQRDYYRSRDAAFIAAAGGNPVGAHPDYHGLRAQDAYVQVGDGTVLSAGKKGSIFNEGDDEPFNTLTGLFMSKDADVGVWEGPVRKGGHVIQLESSFGNGVAGGIALEALDRTDNQAGSLIGVLNYAGDSVTAHISGSVGGLLDGQQNVGDTYAVHAGITGSFDMYKLRAAMAAGGGYNPAGNWSYWNGLASAEGTFDMFKVALSGEVAGGTLAGGADAGTDYGFGAQIGTDITEGVAINLGGRYFNDGTAGIGDGYQVAVQLVAAVTETLKVTGEIGVYGRGENTAAPVSGAYSDIYGSAELAWNPGGGFTSSLGAKVQQNGAYKVTFKAAKAFK